MTQLTKWHTNAESAGRTTHRAILTIQRYLVNTVEGSFGLDEWHSHLDYDWMNEILIRFQKCSCWISLEIIDLVRVKSSSYDEDFIRCIFATEMEFGREICETVQECVRKVQCKKASLAFGRGLPLPQIL